MHAPLLWVDIETLGLSEHNRCMLEVGLVLTDASLEVVAQTDIVIGWRNVRSLPADPAARAMHEVNGLLDEVEASHVSMREAEAHLLAWVERHDAKGLYMAGSGIGFDRRWLRVQMPTLAEVWHYRNFDMTTIRYFFGSEKREPAHRALADIHQSIEELRAAVAQARRAGLVAIPAMVA